MSFVASYSDTRPFQQMEELRYAEGVDQRITYLRLLVCLLHSKAVADPPMTFRVRGSKSVVDTTKLEDELQCEAIVVAKSSLLDLDQGQRVIGVLLYCLDHVQGEYTPSVKKEYENVRAHCLWLQVKAVVDGHEAMHPDVIKWAYMVAGTKILPRSYTLCVSAMVAHCTGDWNAAARQWRLARDQYKHTLTQAQTEFLERYDAKMYSTSTVYVAKHFAIDPLSSSKNDLFRFGEDPLLEHVF